MVNFIGFYIVWLFKKGFSIQDVPKTIKNNSSHLRICVTDKCGEVIISSLVWAVENGQSANFPHLQGEQNRPKFKEEWVVRKHLFNNIKQLQWEHGTRLVDRS